MGVNSGEGTALGGGGGDDDDLVWQLIDTSWSSLEQNNGVQSAIDDKADSEQERGLIVGSCGDSRVPSDDNDGPSRGQISAVLDSGKSVAGVNRGCLGRLPTFLVGIGQEALGVGGISSSLELEDNSSSNLFWTSRLIGP